jgi:AcrR family transcriptional regulator
MALTRAKSPQTQAERRELARSRILAAAIELVGERGLDRFTMREVSARAGSSANLAAHYFPSKAVLLDAVAKDLLRAPDSLRPSPKVGLDELMSAMCSALASDLGDPISARARLVFMTEMHPGSPYRAAVAAYYKDRISGISAHLAAGQAAGEIRAFDCEAQALVIMATRRGMVLMTLTELNVDAARLTEAYLESLRSSLVA